MGRKGRHWEREGKSAQRKRRNEDPYVLEKRRRVISRKASWSRGEILGGGAKPGSVRENRKSRSPKKKGGGLVEARRSINPGAYGRKPARKKGKEKREEKGRSPKKKGAQVTTQCRGERKKRDALLEFLEGKNGGGGEKEEGGRHCEGSL